VSGIPLAACLILTYPFVSLRVSPAMEKVVMNLVMMYMIALENDISLMSACLYWIILAAALLFLSAVVFLRKDFCD